jgi:hypothetical protein
VAFLFNLTNEMYCIKRRSSKKTVPENNTMGIKATNHVSRQPAASTGLVSMLLKLIDGMVVIILFPCNECQS